MRDEGLPALDGLGRDLLNVGVARRAWSLAAPFLFAGAFFVLAARGLWIGALICTMLLTFFTYGSISHDLVHGTLRLPRRANDALLCAVELIALRSGHAYRVVHLHHHARFPADDDLEGAAAAMSWWRALLDGVTLQPRLWRFACARRRDRGWVLGEGAAVIALMLASLAVTPWTVVPAAYVGLMIAGSWTFPFITSFVPHDPSGRSELTKTRLFRGRVLSVVAIEHLYHLEHHLYPQVPHHNWPELARRLDPYFTRAGLRPLKLFF
jgi:beta-carotene hydroxylase